MANLLQGQTLPLATWYNRTEHSPALGPASRRFNVSSFLMYCQQHIKLGENESFKLRSFVCLFHSLSPIGCNDAEIVSTRHVNILWKFYQNIYNSRAELCVASFDVLYICCPTPLSDMPHPASTVCVSVFVSSLSRFYIYLSFYITWQIFMYTLFESATTVIYLCSR